MLTPVEIVENLKQCALYLKSSGLSLGWEALDETALKGGQRLFSAPTWNEFLKEFKKLKRTYELAGKSMGNSAFQMAVIRWIRNQQEMLLKAMLSEKFKEKEHILKVITDEEDVKNFFVDAWISKDYLPLTKNDFVKFVGEISCNQELFLQVAPIQWVDSSTVMSAFTQAGEVAWKNLKMVGFDFKNTVANFFSMSKGKADYLLENIQKVLESHDPKLETSLLEDLTRGFYKNQGRTRQQVTPRIFFTIFVYSDELLKQKNKKDLSRVEKNLVNKFLLTEMETGMKSIVRMYELFAQALVQRKVNFSKLLPVKLQFPAVETKILIASSIVLMVRKEGNNFEPAKVLGIQGVQL